MNLNSLEVRPNIFGSIVPSRMYITKNAQHFKVRDLTINDVQANLNADQRMKNVDHFQLNEKNNSDIPVRPTQMQYTPANL